MTKKKEHTIRYEEKDCQCVNLTKIAPSWFVCNDCGKLFNFLLSMQFTYDQALEHFGKLVNSLDLAKDIIRKAESKREAIEKENEKKAIEDYKKKHNIKPTQEEKSAEA